MISAVHALCPDVKLLRVIVKNCTNFKMLHTNLPGAFLANWLSLSDCFWRSFVANRKLQLGN